MFIPILVALVFSAAFFVESIIGFGGGLIAYSILAFFMDIKSMLMSGVYIGTSASFYILLTDHKSFSKALFLKSLPILLFGTIVGVFIFSLIDPKTMLSLFGIFAIILSAKVIFFDKITFPKFMRDSLLLTGGLATGLFGIGGPFIVNALKNDFKHKSELRSTMAAFFVALGIVRLIQLIIQNQIQLTIYRDIWWVIFPIFAAIYLGYHVHLKISESFFKKMIGTMTLLSGIAFLFK